MGWSKLLQKWQPPSSVQVTFPPTKTQLQPNPKPRKSHSCNNLNYQNQETPEETQTPEWIRVAFIIQHCLSCPRNNTCIPCGLPVLKREKERDRVGKEWWRVSRREKEEREREMGEGGSWSGVWVCVNLWRDVMLLLIKLRHFMFSIQNQDEIFENRGHGYITL